MKLLLNDILAAQDHFGVPPAYLYKTKRLFHTLFCQIISILMNIGCCGMLITLIIELISRNKPSVNHVAVTQNIGSNATVNTEDLIISFGILDTTYSIFSDPSYIQFEALYEVASTSNGSLSARATPINLVNCSDTNLPLYTKYGLKSVFESNNLMNYYCFNNTELDNELVIGGLFGSEFYGVIHAKVKKCVNNTNSDIICKTPEEIAEKTNGFWFEFFFLDHFVDIYDYGQPVQTFSNSLYTWIAPQFYKSIRAYFNRVKVNSDNGIIFEAAAHHNSYKYERMNYDMIGNENDDNLVEFIIISSFNEDIYDRTYIKVQNICANIGGILNGMQVVGIILLSYFEYKAYQIDLIQSIFTFYHVKQGTNIVRPKMKKFVEQFGVMKKTEDNKDTIKTKISHCNLSSLGDTHFTDNLSRKNSIHYNIGLLELVFLKGKCFRSKKSKNFRKDNKKILKFLDEKMEFNTTLLMQNDVMILKRLVSELEKKDVFENITKFIWILGLKADTKISMPSVSFANTNLNESKVSAVSKNGLTTGKSNQELFEKSPNTILINSKYKQKFDNVS